MIWLLALQLSLVPQQQLTNGFGYIGDSINGAVSNYPPRSGQIVARIQF